MSPRWLNIEQVLETSLRNAMAQELDRVVLAGSGSSNEPTGIRNATGVTELSIGTNGAAITDWTEILDLWEDLAEANAGEIGAAIMAPRTRTTISKFKDTTNQPLGRPDVLRELPLLATSQVGIAETQGTASDASTLYIGDWSEVMLGIRTQFTLRTLRELYAGNFQLGFLAVLRADIQLARPAALGRLIGITP